MIIALGESLIAAGTAVSGEPRTAALMRLVVAALAVACLLWWSYFGWLKRATERGLAAAPADRIGAVARDAFSLGHFPLLCGVIGFAVAIEEMMHHPTTPPSGDVVAALGVGIALFIGSTVWVYWRTCHQLLVSRLVLLVLTEGVLVLLADQEPVWLLAVFVVGLLGIVVIEAVAPAGRQPPTSSRSRRPTRERARRSRAVAGPDTDPETGAHACRPVRHVLPCGRGRAFGGARRMGLLGAREHCGARRRGRERGGAPRRREPQSLGALLAVEHRPRHGERTAWHAATNAIALAAWDLAARELDVACADLWGRRPQTDALDAYASGYFLDASLDALVTRSRAGSRTRAFAS